MSNRKAAFSAPDKNPSTKFLTWKSEQKCFEYYDREKKEKVLVPLPFKFLVLDELHTVTGWNDATSSGIYSNEVKYISKDKLSVKPFKGNEIASGLYKDIKEKIKAAGGHYVRSIYIMLENGDIANIHLKGSGVQAWGEFSQNVRSRITDEWITVGSAIEEKKGRVVYSVPFFTFDKSLTTEEAATADKCFDTLEVYLKNHLGNEPEAVEDEEEVDLDF
jgi:hypothetical protein